MSNYKIFSNAQFGEIRVRPGSVPLFCLVDLCRAMGFYNPSSVKKSFKTSDVVMLRCETAGTQRAKRNMNFVTENAVAQLINKESNRDLTAFREWMSNEVLPQSKTEETPARLVERDEVMAVMEGTAIQIDRLTKRIAKLEQRLNVQPAQQVTIVNMNPQTSTIADYVAAHHIPIGRKEHSYYSVVARSICRIRGIDVGVVVVNNKTVNAYPVDVLVEVFKDFNPA